MINNTIKTCILSLLISVGTVSAYAALFTQEDIPWSESVECINEDGSGNWVFITVVDTSVWNEKSLWKAPVDVKYGVYPQRCWIEA